MQDTLKLPSQNDRENGRDAYMERDRSKVSWNRDRSKAACDPSFQAKEKWRDTFMERDRYGATLRVSEFRGKGFKRRFVVEIIKLSG